jgi:hypothetical protein
MSPIEPGPPIGRRMSLSFGRTLLAATLGALIAGLLIASASFVYINWQLSRMAEAMSDTFESIPDTESASNSDAIDKCWAAYFEDFTTEEFAPWAEENCPEAGE